MMADITKDVNSILCEYSTIYSIITSDNMFELNYKERKDYVYTLLICVLLKHVPTQKLTFKFCKATQMFASLISIQLEKPDQISDLDYQYIVLIIKNVFEQQTNNEMIIRVMLHYLDDQILHNLINIIETVEYEEALYECMQ